ncbi:MAG: ATP-binding protein [Phycisphaerae bacterium]|nr:ATP-binding protein [Phycisphaerae bacterium]
MPSLDPSTASGRSATHFDIRREGGNLIAEFNSDPAHIRTVRQAVEEFCREAGFDEVSCHEIGFAVNEAVANIIRHAYHSIGQMPIDLKVRKSASEIEIELRDWGSGRMPPSEKLSCSLSECPVDPSPGGLGLVCMRALMDELTFEPRQPGMVLRMRRSKDRRPYIRVSG